MKVDGSEDNFFIFKLLNYICFWEHFKFYHQKVSPFLPIFLIRFSFLPNKVRQYLIGESMDLFWDLGLSNNSNVSGTVSGIYKLYSSCYSYNKVFVIPKSNLVLYYAWINVDLPHNFIQHGRFFIRPTVICKSVFT